MTPKAAVPVRCAVAVVCGEHLVSQIYPASVPVEMFIDDIVELLTEELRKRGAPGPEPAVAYELQKANGVRLDIAKTLDELGVEDGTTLVLAAAEDGDPFEPQCESLSTGLAQAGRRLFPPVTDRTAAHTAIAILGLVAAVLLGLGGSTRIGSESSVPALIVGGYGTAVAVGALAVCRWWPGRRDLSAGFAWIAAPLLALGGAAAAPGRLGSPHLFIAALAGLVLTVAMAGLTRCPTAGPAAGATLCGIAGVAAAVDMWRPIPGQWMGMATLVGLLLLVTVAPTSALWVARVRPPHFGSVTGRDLFSRRNGMPIDAVAPVEDGATEAVESHQTADPTPTGAMIAASAVRANGILTGMCLAAGIALPAAVWSTVVPGQARSGAAAVLGGLFVLIFISRARSFADRRQAVSLVCGAAAAFCAGVARYVLIEPPGTALLWGGLLLIGFGAAGLGAALLVPVTPFTPLVRMVAEWLELLAIAIALPLAAWTGGLFAWVRMR